MMNASTQLIQEISAPKSQSKSVQSNSVADRSGNHFSEVMESTENESNKDLNQGGEAKSQFDKSKEKESSNNDKSVSSSEANKNEKNNDKPVSSSEVNNNEKNNESVQTESEESEKSAELTEATETKSDQAELSEEYVTEQPEVKEKTNFRDKQGLLLAASIKLEVEEHKNDQNALREFLASTASKDINQFLDGESEEIRSQDSKSLGEKLRLLMLERNVASGKQEGQAKAISEQKSMLNIAVTNDAPLSEDVEEVLKSVLTGVDKESQPKVISGAENSLARAIGKELKADQAVEKTNLLPELKATDEQELLSAEDLDLEEKSDELISKILERLNLENNKSQLQQQIKMASEKGSDVSALIDQLTKSLALETGEKPLFLNAQTNTVRSQIVSPPPTQMVMSTPVNQPEWGADFSKRIHFLIRNEIQQAELRLDPPELGKIQVRINISQDQANITFSSQHGNVREAIEQTLPKLRELLSDSGLQLGDTDVASSFKQENEEQSEEENQSSQVSVSDILESDIDTIENQGQVVSADGVIDYFA